MHFKGRTVLMIVVLAMTATVFGTLTVANQLKWTDQPSSVAVAAPESDDSYKLKSDELNKINAILELIETKYVEKIDRDELLDGAVSGLMGALRDPYSVYMEKDVAQHFSESIEGSFTGIGAEVTMESGNVVVVAPIKGSPAEKSGLLSRDVLLSVNGEKLDGLSLQEAVNKIRGPKGTKAKLLIRRDGFAEPIQIVLIRDDIDIETVYGTLREDGVGVIEIRQFAMHTAERFQEELEKLEQGGMTGLVIDVRNNPGGVLPVVIDIAQLLVKEGSLIVQVEDREGNRQQTYAKGGEQKSYPIAVLTNGGSASASEILAGALRETAGAKVIGETTFGKGTVQVSYNKMLGDGSLVKMTIAKWLTPNGNWIHESGIKPDIEIAPPDMYTVARLSLDETLKRDDLSERVRSAQIMLDGLGYDTQRKDGYFNDGTEEAVRQFQQANSLPATGEIDTETAQTLEETVVKWIQNKENDLQLLRAVQTVSKR